MKKNYQTTVHAGRITPKKPTVERAAEEAAQRGLPNTVTIAIADLAGELEEGLLAFAVATSGHAGVKGPSGPSGTPGSARRP